MTDLAKVSNLSLDFSAHETEAPINDTNPRNTIYEPIVGCFDKMKDKFQGGSILGSISTLMMVSLGTGLLALPYTIQQSGIIWGIMQLIVCGVLGFYSLSTVVRCAVIQKASSYQELAEKAYGKKLRNCVNIVFFLGAAGSVMVYFQVVANLLPVFVSSVSKDSNLIAWMHSGVQLKIIPVVIATIFVLPLSLPKELKKLRYLWLLGAFLILVICIILVSETFVYKNPSTQSNSVELFNIGGFYTTFPTAVFSYMCHFSILDVYGELRNPTKARMRKVILSNTLSIFFLYVIIGIFGYITFGDAMPQSYNRIILLAYTLASPDQSASDYSNTIVACVCIMCIVLIVKAPMYIRPAKDGLKDFFFPRISDRYGEPIETNESPSVHFVLVTVTVYVCALVAMFADSIGVATNIIGSTFYVLTCFVFPAIFYLGCPRGNQKKFHRVCCWLMLVSMSLFGIWNTFENIKAAINGTPSE